LVNATMEAYAQDRPSSRTARRHAVSNALVRGFSAILTDAG